MEEMESDACPLTWFVAEAQQIRVQFAGQQRLRVLTRHGAFEERALLDLAEVLRTGC